ncbi:MAG TPA: MMPL family transporter, partial [Actinomycetota bacterium]
MTRVLERLARWSYEHRWRMLGIWVVALIGFGVLMNVAGGPYATTFSLPGTESQATFDLLKARFPAQAGDQATVVFRANQGIADPSVRTAMQRLFAEVASLPHVDSVASPYTPGRGQAQVSRDGTIAFATVQFDVQAGDVPKATVDRMKTLAERAAGPGLEIELGGPVIEQSEFQPPGGAEAVGLGAAIIILLLTFGSLLAMGLPILVALFGIGIGLSLVLLFANFLSVPNFTPQLASMIGIGVGIDYAL